MTATALAEKLRSFIHDPNEFRPGIIRQLMENSAYVETENSSTSGRVLLEALLQAIENMAEQGASREGIIAAANDFNIIGKASTELYRYVGGFISLQSEEEPYNRYVIDLQEALPEIMLYLDSMTEETDYPGGRDASNIYEDLKRLTTELETLVKAGRITMSTDSWNQDYRDSKQAIQHALFSLQEAINATCWMETLPAADTRL